MTTRKRTISAWLLLIIFGGILAMSVAHRHEPAAQSSETCVECLSGVHHHSHISTQNGCAAHCLVCQFMRLAYLFPKVFLFSPVLVFVGGLAIVRPAAEPLWRSDIHSTRAPPFQI